MRRSGQGGRFLLAGVAAIGTAALWNGQHSVGALLLAVPSCYLLVRAFIFGSKRLVERRRYNAITISDVDNMNGWGFERYVAMLLTRQGYKATTTPGSRDMGVDIVACKGRVRLAVQCKRQGDPVDRRAIGDVVAGARHWKCNAVMVVTNSSFARAALELAEANEVELVDRQLLGEWIVAFGK